MELRLFSANFLLCKKCFYKFSYYKYLIIQQFSLVTYFSEMQRFKSSNIGRVQTKKVLSYIGSKKYISNIAMLY